MNAMIFAAGLGERLKPLTGKIPKALVPLHGKPMLQWIVEKLIAAGAKNIVINIHHLAPVMKSFLSGLNYPGVAFHISDETEELLDTGGGLKKAEKLLNNGRISILHNVDVVSDISLHDMVDAHIRSGALATLAVTERHSDRKFLWHKDQLAGWENRKTGSRVICAGNNPDGLTPMAFSGIHVVDPMIFSLISEKAPFSIKDLYLRLAEDHPIKAYIHDAERWVDIGTPEKLSKAASLTDLYPEMLHQQTDTNYRR